MPKIGLSRPYVAKYNNNAGVITYTEGIRLGRAVEMGIEVESVDASDFYADNVVAESISGVFKSGKLSITTAELNTNETVFIVGNKITEMEMQGLQVKEVAYDKTNIAPYLGFGAIIKEMYLGQERYRAMILRKIAFDIPSEDIKTQGEEIEWQTQEAAAKVMRDDSPKGQWRVDGVELESEELADIYIRTKLGMDVIPIGKLSVTSAAGTTTGKTAITVTPAKKANNSYMYKVGVNVMLPYHEQTIDKEAGYLEWDGSSNVLATTGSQIVVVEVDAAGLAINAGKATVTAK